MNTNIVFGILIAFIFVLLIILFCVILIKRFISRVKKHNQILYQKEIDQKKAINHTILEVQEETLNRISRELHDDAGQQLTHINFQLENLKLINPAISNSIAPISDSLSYLSQSIRDLSHSINSQKLKNYRLIENIKKELDKINELNVISCELNTAIASNDIFTPEESIVLFRIFQEALNNTLKHAKASTFIVAIVQNPKLAITFEDDGIGFSSDNISNKASHGLKIIENRSRIIDFECRISSQKDHGTKIGLIKV